MKFKKLVLPVLCLIPVISTAAAPDGPKKETPYDKFIKTTQSSAEGEFVSLYQAKGNKLFMEFSRKNVGRRFLAGSTIKSVSNPTRVDIGYKYEDPLLLQLELEDSVVVLNKPNPAVSVRSGDPRLLEATRTSYRPILFKRIPVKAFSADSSRFVFEITDLVNDLVNTGVVNATKDKSSYSIEAIKSFKDNASVTVKQNAEIKSKQGAISFLFGAVTVESTVSFLELPDERMKPRLLDSRVGVFPTFNTIGGANGTMKELDGDEDGMRDYLFASRWRLEPVDLAAWQRGEVVPVKKPIVWYVDSTFPASWVPSIKKGVLAWNAAFERIGLKDVMQVRDFPTPEEDPEFDPDNLKYSCIRYVVRPVANAMGPSWKDPLTGEILNASVLVYNDVIRLINNWRFVLTAQVDERVRARRMPQDVIDESMVYVISHEIGHTLGLMHNMGASSAYPVEKLRDPGFTAEYGTTPSIMDYARFNYVAQPSDKGVRLTPPDLGVYDKYAIEWLYKPVPGAKDMWEESAIAERLVDAHAGDPMYRYGPQQSATFYDPSARTEDLGDDPIKASEYGIANLKYILPNISAWITDDPDRRHRTQLYNQLVNQYLRYLNNVLNQVGGIYLNEVKDGTEGEPVKAVPKDVQKASLQWVLDQVKTCGEWLNAPELTDRFTLHADISNSVASNIARSIMAGIASDVVISAHVAKDGGYSVAEFYDDLYRQIFASSIHRKALTSEEKMLQREVIGSAMKNIPDNPGTKKLSEGEEDLTVSNTCGYASGLPELGFGESRGYGQLPAGTTFIDESPAYRLQFLTRINDLAKSRQKSAPEADRAHYAYLYKVTAEMLAK